MNPANLMNKNNNNTHINEKEGNKSYCQIIKNFFLDKDIYENLTELEKLQKIQGDEKEYDSCIKNIFHKSLFQVIENDQNTHIQKNNQNKIYSILGSDVLGDLEILQDYANTENSNNTLLNMLSNSEDWSPAQHKLRGSQFFMRNLLSNPICSLPYLQHRQHTIKHVLDKHEKEDKLEHSWRILQKNEKKLSWFYDENKDVSGNLYDMVYLNYWLLQRLNKSDKFLTGYNLYRIILSPLIGIFTPICYVLIPFIVLRRRWNIPIDFKTYLKMTLQMFLSSNSMLPASLERFRKISVGFTIVFYFQGLFNTIELSRAIYKLTSLLVTKINSLINFIHHANQIVQIIGDENINVEYFGYNKDFFKNCHRPQQIEETQPQTNELNSLNDLYFQTWFAPDTALDKQVYGGEDGEQFSIFSNFGNQLSLYKYLQIENYKPLLRKIFLIDTLRSIGKLTTPKEKNERQMCWTQYITKDGPFVDIHECFHPCLTNVPFLNIVKNDIKISKVEENGNKNIILTGPNAGGKSTIIKSLMISILLSQTITVSNAKELTMSPFTFINTQINIPDCKGKQSLFEAEMFRSKHNFDIIESLQPNENCIIAMDEIFSSTNPIEGMAGAYAIANKLGKYPQVINIISTHYIFLSKLEKKSRLYSNYKMNVNLDENNNVVSYPYKLYRGVSRQYIALELLRKNGFDNDLIDEAVQIKNSFLIQKK